MTVDEFLRQGESARGMMRRFPAGGEHVRRWLRNADVEGVRLDGDEVREAFGRLSRGMALGPWIGKRLRRVARPAANPRSQRDESKRLTAAVRRVKRERAQGRLSS